MSVYIFAVMGGMTKRESVIIRCFCEQLSLPEISRCVDINKGIVIKGLSLTFSKSFVLFTKKVPCILLCRSRG